MENPLGQGQEAVSTFSENLSPAAAIAPTPTALALLAVMRLKGVGRRKALTAIDHSFADTDDHGCRDELVGRLSRTFSQPVARGALLTAWEKSREQLDRCREMGVQVLSYHDEGYPERLRKIPDPPAVLFVKGSAVGLRAARSIAVVGTREPTECGVEAARRGTTSATQAGFVIVSGLAHGCDTYAHEGCVAADGVGVAVLAHGLEKVYPAANRELAERLLDNGGCLTSEYPVGMRPTRSAFAERDRIQSGLSDAIYVIETDVVGGTMHTVRFARDQGRPIACVAHPQKYLTEAKVRGNQKLIRDGWAIPISNKDEFRDFLAGIKPVVESDDQQTGDSQEAQGDFGF